MKESFKDWEEVYKKYNKNSEGYLWPSETLIRLLKGNYVANLNKEYRNKRVLDIGFGNGNNLVLLSTLKMKVYGIEVTDDICEITENKLQNLGYDVNLKKGSNRNIPYNNNFFDYIVSWNVIHYENTETKIQKALKEYHRVLKPGGRFFISTTGPEHKILKNFKQAGEHRYIIQREDDFRCGQVYYYFDDRDNIRKQFSEYFDKIRIGRTKSNLISETLDYFIITGIK